MTTPEPYEFTENGGLLKIFRSADIPGAAAIRTDCTVRVPAHRLAEVVAAMYEAAGQPVPDLPVIHDREHVKRLAALLHEHSCRPRQDHLGLSDEDTAARLLAHGVRLPEATP